MANYSSPNIEITDIRIITDGDITTDIINGDRRKLVCRAYFLLDQNYFNTIKNNPALWCHTYFRIVNPANNNILVKYWAFMVLSSISQWGRSFWLENGYDRARDWGAYGPGVYRAQPEIVINNVWPGAGWYVPDASVNAFAVGDEHYFSIA